MCYFHVDSVHKCSVRRDKEIVIKNVFGRKIKINGLNKSDFWELLKLTTMGLVFCFNGNYYTS